MLLAPALVLNANHPRVAAARERARTDPHLAASLLARSLLLRRGVLSKRRSEVLLSRTLDRLVGGKR
jgi:hypothetical protein